MDKIDKIKATVEIAELRLAAIKAIAKAWSDIPFPASIAAVSALAETFELTLPIQAFKIWDKYKHKGLEKGEEVIMPDGELSKLLGAEKVN